MRASEQSRPAAERILDDPYAASFLGPTLRAGLAAFQGSGRVGGAVLRHAPGLTVFVLARHRFIDDRLRAALTRRRAPIRQVVALGAGYDMRAARVVGDRRNVRVFEVDHPATARRKARCRAALRRKHAVPGPDPVVVTVDFQRESFGQRLREAGYDPSERAFFTWEGVSMYLSRGAVKKTLATIAELAPVGSELCFDGWFLLDSPGMRSAAHRFSASLLVLLGEPILFGLHPEDMGPFLRSLGFELVELLDADALAERYVTDGRPVYPASYVVAARR